MCASRYGYRHESRVVAQVQVKNLNKKTKLGYLKRRLNQFTFLDVKLIACLNRQTNYAYIHFKDYRTAQEVADAIHNKMTIDSNLLRAVVKDGFTRATRQKEHDTYHSQAEDNYETEEEREDDNYEQKPSYIDPLLVNLLVYDKESPVTEADLKILFERYGKVDSISTKFESYLHSATVHYSKVVSAHTARYHSPHSILNTTVIAVPLDGETPPGSEVTTLEFDCDPVVFKYAEKDLQREFREDPRYVIISKRNKFVAHFHGSSKDFSKEKITSITSSYMNMLDSTCLELHDHFLPILADPEVRKKISASAFSFEVKILKGKTVVSLECLSQKYSDENGDLLERSDFQQYMSPSTSEKDKAQYKWYWQDDDKLYQPYSEEMNQRMENYYAKKLKGLVGIGRFTYIINCVTMTQTNTSTGKSRHMKREQISEEVLVLNIRITTIRNQLESVKSAFTRLMDNSSHKTRIEVPETASQSGVFQDEIKKIKKEKFIQITLDEDQNASLTIQGKLSLVNAVELQLHKTILKLVADRSFHMTIPKTWEPQTNKCELKAVTRGTPEWKTIQDKMTQSNDSFTPRIHNIERIQNTWLWELYQLSKKRMSQKNDGEVNEEVLFHGTRNTAPKDIYDSEQGFDNRLASKGLWGEGIYFAAKAKYSDSYAHTIKSGHKQMFLAQVITGVAFKHSSKDGNLKAPPKKEDHVSFFASIFYSQKSKFEGERYDSVTATANGSKIYVIYELGRVYPSYLITYSSV